MADYKELKPFILKWEGGYVNHPNDPGGHTNMGVTLANYEYYCRLKNIRNPRSSS